MAMAYTWWITASEYVIVQVCTKSSLFECGQLLEYYLSRLNFLSYSLGTNPVVGFPGLSTLLRSRDGETFSMTLSWSAKEPIQGSTLNAFSARKENFSRRGLPFNQAEKEVGHESRQCGTCSTLYSQVSVTSIWRTELCLNLGDLLAEGSFQSQYTRVMLRYIICKLLA